MKPLASSQLGWLVGVSACSLSRQVKFDPLYVNPWESQTTSPNISKLSLKSTNNKICIHLSLYLLALYNFRSISP